LRNSVSFIHVVEGGTVPSFPTTMPPIWISTTWHLYFEKNSKIKFSTKYSLRNPIGREEVLIDFGVEIERRSKDKNESIHRNNVQLPQIKADEPGMHYIVVYSKIGSGKWKKEAEIPLTLNLRQPSSK